MPKVKQFDEQAVLEKAMELFWKKGYHATSMQDLVTFLGISRSSIYDTFGGKRALFGKTFQYYRTSNIVGVKAFLNSQTSVKKGFELLFSTAINDTLCDKDSKGCFVVNTTTELLPGDDELNDVLDHNRNTFEKIYYNFLQKGVESGEIPKGKDLETISSLLVTFYHGIKVVSKIKSNEQQLLKSVSTLLSLLD